jgi:hypothetical protein
MPWISVACGGIGRPWLTYVVNVSTAPPGLEPDEAQLHDLLAADIRAGAFGSMDTTGTSSAATADELAEGAISAVVGSWTLFNDNNVMLSGRLPKRVLASLVLRQRCYGFSQPVTLAKCRSTSRNL